MSKAKQPVIINGIEFDALISEEDTLEATVPEYAVESGFTVSDAILLGAEKLSMVLYVTDTPVTWNSRHGSGKGRAEYVASQLKSLYFSKALCTISTSDNVYTNMGIESLVISKTLEVGYAREIPISFKKVNVTATQTTSIPASYGKSGTTGASAGNANTSQNTTGSSDGSTSSNSSSNGNKSEEVGPSAMHGMLNGVFNWLDS